MAGLIACLATVLVGLILTGIAYHIWKPRDKRINTNNPLSPTLQWMNTSASILIAANNGIFENMAGVFYPGNEKKPNRVQQIKKMLQDYWGIETHDKALEEMLFLLNTGMRAQYDEDMQMLEYIFKNYSEEELIQESRKQNPNADEDSFLPKMLMAYRRYGKNALLGWDMGRAAFVIQCCYFVGYATMEEVLEIGVEAGKKAQAVFNSWEEMMESYLLGIQYWQQEDKGDLKSMTAKRWKIYQKLWRGDTLFRESPYLSIPFDLELSKEIITDQYGFLLKNK